MLSTLTTVNESALAEIEEEKSVRKTTEVFLLFTMGSQFDHLIKAHLMRWRVRFVADPASLTAEDVRRVRPIGILVSGGPASVFDEPPPFDAAIFDLQILTLVICLGFQMWAKYVGARPNLHPTASSTARADH
ncbi:MAG: hypothetical protein U0514_01985 [Candidatus Andersenbacteria bacterium]